MATPAIQITGVKELDNKLKRLPRTMVGKIVKPAARKALKPILQKVRKNAPKKTGALRRGIKIKTPRSRKRAGARIETNRDQFYGTILEFDHKSKSGSTISGLSFMTKAFENEQRGAREVFMREIVAGLDKWAKSG